MGRGHWGVVVALLSLVAVMLPVGAQQRYGDAEVAFRVTDGLHLIDIETGDGEVVNLPEDLIVVDWVDHTRVVGYNVATRSPDGSIRLSSAVVHDVEDGSSETLLSVPQHNVEVVALSPDGSTLAFWLSGEDVYDFYVGDVATGDYTRVPVEDIRVEVDSVDFGHDNVLYGYDDVGNGALWKFSPDEGIEDLTPDGCGGACGGGQGLTLVIDSFDRALLLDTRTSAFFGDAGRFSSIIDLDTLEWENRNGDALGRAVSPSERLTMWMSGAENGRDPDTLWIDNHDTGRVTSVQTEIFGTTGVGGGGVPLWRPTSSLTLPDTPVIGTIGVEPDEPNPTDEPVPVSTDGPADVFPDGDGATIDRIVADDPAQFAVHVSRLTYGNDGAAYVVLSRDDAFPDSLAGSALLDVGPLLFTTNGDLTPETEAEIDRVLPNGGTVIILGGPSAVSVEPEGYDILRLAGGSRVETAAAVAYHLHDQADEQTDTVFIARADNWADAVAIGAVASRTQSPVLLTDTNNLHPATATALVDLDPSNVVILGGTSAISADVENELRDIAPAAAVDRIAGASRVNTAHEIATAFPVSNDNQDMVVIGPGYVDNGWTFVLASVPLAIGSHADLYLEFAPDCRFDDVGMVGPTVFAANAEPC